MNYFVMSNDELAKLLKHIDKQTEIVLLNFHNRC